RTAGDSENRQTPASRLPGGTGRASRSFGPVGNFGTVFGRGQVRGPDIQHTHRVASRFEMKVGLVGYSGSGKSTVFQWLTGEAPDPAKVQQGQMAMADVPDERLDKLSAHFKPKKGTKYAAIAFLDTPGLMLGERKDNPRRLGILREANGLLVVLDGFSATNLAEQLTKFREELVFADLDILANRIEKLTAQFKRTKPVKEREQDQAELDQVKHIHAALEAGQPPRSIVLRPEEEKLVRSFQLFTLKP